VADLCRQVCRSRGLAPEVVTVQGTATSWPVDRRRFAQILGNLLDNADRHGGGAVAVRVGAGPDRLVLEVDDEGPGVRPEDRVAIFDRFVRGPAAGARGDGDGTGLGLALVARHAAAHGGTAEVADRPGGGARFRIELPS